MKTFVFELNTYMSNQNPFYLTNTITKKKLRSQHAHKDDLFHIYHYINDKDLTSNIVAGI